MKLFKLSFLFCFGLALCSWDMLQTEPSSIENGEEIYKNYCKSCHGKKGSLGFGGAAKLIKSKMPLEERIDVITNGKGKMAPYGALLSEDEIKAVAMFTETFSK